MQIVWKNSTSAPFTEASWGQKRAGKLKLVQNLTIAAWVLIPFQSPLKTVESWCILKWVKDFTHPVYLYLFIPTGQTIIRLYYCLRVQQDTKTGKFILDDFWSSGQKSQASIIA